MIKLKEIFEGLIEDNTCIFCKEIVDEDLRKWVGKGGKGGVGGGGWSRGRASGGRAERHLDAGADGGGV